MPTKADQKSAEAESLGRRIDEVVRVIGTRADAARVAGVSVQHLGQLIAGKSASPSAVMLSKLSEESGYSLDWIVLGKEPRCYGDSGTTNPATHPAPIDSRFFGRIAGAIGKAYKEAGAVIDCDALGTLAADEYSAVAALASNEDEQIAIAKMVKSKHLHRLSTESMASRKRRA